MGKAGKGKRRQGKLPDYERHLLSPLFLQISLQTQRGEHD